MKVVILCGGRGKRALPLTEDLPKPMLPVGGSPILVHIMRLFADQGHREFVLAAGYRQEVIRDYFKDADHGWSVEVVDTGAEAETGDRILACRPRLGARFFVTYGDGLADVSLDRLMTFHDAHAGLASVTSVPLTCQYGTLEMDPAGRIGAFREKPVLRGHWINAGFMAMNHQVFDQWVGASLEREVLPHLAERGLVYGYRHEGFFKSLDSHKDQQELELMLQSGPAPWLPRAAARK